MFTKQILLSLKLHKEALIIFAVASVASKALNKYVITMVVA